MWTPSDITKATGARQAGGPADVRFSGVSIDSRSMTFAASGEPGDLFVAIAGETHDGHDFVKNVVNAGGRGVVVNNRFAARFSKAKKAAKTAVFAVDDTLAALQNLAAYHRKRNPALAVAITGTNGKTTTKEMTRSILEQKAPTLANKGNLNNHIGVPLTLLALEESHAFAVVEMGMNHPGEIRRLAEITSPQVGVVTNVGPGHLEGVGSVEGVARAKKELIKAMADGVAVLNADDDRVSRFADDFAGDALYFGFNPKAQVRAESVAVTDQGMSFALCLPGESVDVDLSLFGAAMVSNALAAAGAAYALGFDGPTIARGLNACRPVAGRLVVTHHPAGVTIIDDTYNANPASMASAAQALCARKGTGRAHLVTGDMHELGTHAQKAHQDLGRLAARLGVDRLYSTGHFADQVAAKAVEAGMDPACILATDKQAIVASLGETVRPGDWVLVKGSRLAAMEEVVRGLIGLLDLRCEHND